MLQIDTSKVLLIVNADNAQSISDANDYVIKRGLNSAHRLAFNFGTSNATLTETELRNGTTLQCQTAPYIGHAFFGAISDYIQTHAIEAVIVSTYTPSSVASGAAVYTLASHAGAASWYQTHTTGTPFYFTGSTPTRNTIETIINNVPDDWRPNGGSNPFGFVPHGRLGCPDYTNGTIAEVALRASIGVESIYTHAVTGALSAELVDHTNAQHALTQTLNYNIISASMNKTAFDWAKRLAMPNVANMGVDFVMNENATPPITLPAPLFALSLGVVYNGPDTGLADAFTCASGAWGFVWTSSAGIFGTDVLYNGGAAAVLTMGEPFNNAIPYPNELFIYATAYQTSLALAHFLAYGNGMGSTVFGDPLYRPYLSTGVTPPKPWVFI